MMKMKDENWGPFIMENPISWRDQLIKECWHEIKGLPKPVFENTWEGPIEPRIQILKEKMEKFEQDAEKLKAQLQKKQEEKKMKATSGPAKKEQKKPDPATAQPDTQKNPAKKMLNPNFVVLEGDSEKKIPQVLQYKPMTKEEESKGEVS